MGICIYGNKYFGSVSTIKSGEGIRSFAVTNLKFVPFLIVYYKSWQGHSNTNINQKTWMFQVLFASRPSICTMEGLGTLYKEMLNVSKNSSTFYHGNTNVSKKLRVDIFSHY